MPALTVDGTAQLTSFFHGLTEEMARTLWTAALESDKLWADAAMYYTVTRNGKSKRVAYRVCLSLDSTDLQCGFVVTDDYHPRKDGKAQFIFQTDYVYND